eukprot:g2209.t1
MAKKKKISSKKAKTLQKRIVEDKTFGLKNKKGGKMKKFMARGKSEEAAAAERKRAKAARAKEEALMNKLFAAAPKKELAPKKKGFSVGVAVKKKKKKKKKKGSAPAPPPPPPVDNRPIEIIIEEKRSNLYSSGKKLTPVTPETFAAWKKRFNAKRKKEMDKKNKGKKQKLSGRELYKKNSSAFKDDDSAVAEKFKVKGILDAEVEEEASTKEADGALDIDAVLPVGEDGTNKSSSTGPSADDAIDTSAFADLDIGDLEGL